MRSPIIEIEEDYFDIEKEESVEDAYGVLDSSFVIYGYGKAGKRFISRLENVENNNVLAICDNGNNDDENVIKHKECIRKYPENNYIVTMQKGYIDVICSLIRDGIKSENIYRYNFANDRLEK